MLPDDWLEQLKLTYPRRNGDQGWGKVRSLVPREISKGATWERMLKGAQNYAKHCQKAGNLGTEYIKQAATFFGRDQWFEEWADMDLRTPAEIALDKQWAALEARARALGFKEVDRSRGLATAEYAIKAEEDKRRLRVVG